MSGLNYNRHIEPEPRPVSNGYLGDRLYGYDGAKLRRLITEKYGSLEDYAEQAKISIFSLRKLVDSKGRPYIGPFLTGICVDLEIEVSDLAH